MAVQKATRDQIVEMADRLFYEQGFSHTSFADVASAIGISRGNFYYHFKTKDEILGAVIERRKASTRAMLADWEAESASPMARIECFIKILIRNRSKIMQFGCPVGTLSAELSKLDHAAHEDAAEIFSLFRDWLRAQFEAMGCGARSDALALHALALSQGVASLATAFRDEAFVDAEVEALCAWLRESAPASEARPS